jgi:hypothetical protein
MAEDARLKMLKASLESGPSLPRRKGLKKENSNAKLCPHYCDRDIPKGNEAFIALEGRPQRALKKDPCP